MTSEQRRRCEDIIHGHAVAACAGNVIPVPGLGVAADLATMTTMAVALSHVFGGSITRNVAESLAINALKQEVLKQPIKSIAKELAKIVPFAGSAFAASISFGMLEAAGWEMAERLARAEAEAGR